ncbi:MAG: polysaccharide ABC transporter ATP-binding protein [Candidatus Sumerlaeota bacterium]|nr:polysaccharide ABC transporter ATP-binding protein [Candidatus Sumerlaeota bacterium]
MNLQTPKGRIFAQGLFKQFQHRLEKSGTIKETVVRWIKGHPTTPTSNVHPVHSVHPVHPVHPTSPQPKIMEIRALEPLDLTIEPGQSLGVIGANGSGKSTLLKLIAGITPPSGGRLEVGGRVAALLELGAGFHPDLSGLDNIYQMASMMGLTRAETRRRLDDIIAFSGVRPFIHEPLKHYSTGMQVRLGFSVAAHLDPDIILLDEVIAVGDADFQLQSFDKIQRLRDAGKTIILVTHQMDAVERMCEKALWLEHGRVQAYGPPLEVIERYQDGARGAAAEMERVECDPRLVFLRPTVRMGSGEALIERVTLTGAAGADTRHFEAGEPVRVRVYYRVVRPVGSLACVLGINTLEGTGITVKDSSAEAWLPATPGGGGANGGAAGTGYFECLFDPPVFGGGSCQMTVMLIPRDRQAAPYDSHIRFYTFEVRDAGRHRLRPALRLPCRISVYPNNQLG